MKLIHTIGQTPEEIINAHGLSGLVIHNSPNLVYLTGVNIRTFERPLFFITNGKEHVIVAPKLDEGKLKRFEAGGGKVHVYEDGEDIEKTLRDIADSLGITGGKVGIDDSIKLRDYRMLCKIFGEGNLTSVTDYISRSRYSKREEELRNIKRAVGILDDVYRKVESNIEPGITEALLSSLINSWAMELGADETYFSAVQSGENSAIPHHERSSRKLMRGDVVVIDVSITYNNYFADLTRVFAIEPVDKRVKQHYEAVMRAVEEAFSSVRTGARASSVDKAARKLLEGFGLSQFFIHRLGHGIGVEVHEPPYLSPNSVDVLAEGNTFTIEPGVYFPGKYGLRLERNVALTQDGPVFLDRYDVTMITR